MKTRPTRTIDVVPVELSKQALKRRRYRNNVKNDMERKLKLREKETLCKQKQGADLKEKCKKDSNLRDKQKEKKRLEMLIYKQKLKDRKKKDVHKAGVPVRKRTVKTPRSAGKK